ncbi:MAG TPA: nucleotidyl transferase AbiEii/AbiGii toxin family protein [Kineosporiaceae bacterium]|nr:nucleotidyl transferase AbiEii/AbiGii toxin family protein [Kineosporiaceae bacterium]
MDLFTDRPDPAAFAQAVRTAITAYQDAGFRVDVEVSAEVFARLRLTDPSGQSAKVELACDWRAHQPVQLDIGPVLHPDDAVANKVTALFGRAAPRDYVDVHAALVSGRYTPDRLLILAKEHDDGFDPEWFARALLAVDRWPDREYEAYGLDPARVKQMRSDLRQSALGITAR